MAASGVTSSCRTDCQHTYEQLGAPILLHRHTPSYNSYIVPDQEIGGAKRELRREARRLSAKHQRRNRLVARWYYAVDQSFRADTVEEVWSRRKRRKQKQKDSTAEAKDSQQGCDPIDTAGELNNDEEEEEEEKSSERSDKDGESSDTGASEEERSANRKDGWIISGALQRMDPLLNPDFVKEARALPPSVDAARRSILARNSDGAIVRRSYRQYDYPYVSGQYGRTWLGSQYSWMPRLWGHRWNTSLDMATERQNANVAYLAPIHSNALQSALKKNDHASKRAKLLARTKARQKSYPIQADDIYPPTMYGNCLVCVPCRCAVCLQQEHNARPCGWCLIHPTGELLSRVCVSNLLFPNGPRSGAATKRPRAKRHRPHKIGNELDVGDTIVQIIQLEKESLVSCNDTTGKNNSLGLFLVRCCNYCTVIRIEADESPSTSQPQHVENGILCSGTYHLEEVARIDVRSMDRTRPSFRPLHVAGHPRYGNGYTHSKFAMLSRSDRDSSCNTIHHVVFKSKPHVETHKIPCLKTISAIDFTNSNPMTLWAAAASFVRPSLVGDIYSKKPYLGHGMSLYSIDLRSNNASFQWSPSAQEFVVEGIHSISGLMTDWHKEHCVFVTSTSAAKTWEIDGRMSCRAVNTWSLAPLCDDSGALFPPMGVGGGGSLLVDPCASQNRENCRPFLAVDKSPGAYGLQLYQRPVVRPRFQTNSLECVSSLGSHTESRQSRFGISAARSSVFALPDVSDDVFTCGLAAVRAPIETLLTDDEVRHLGYSMEPQDVLCALTMTNKGDVYSHLLLESSDSDTRSHAYSGLVVGCSAVACKGKGSSKSDGSVEQRAVKKCSGGWNMKLLPCNEYPVPSASVLRSTISSKSGCRPFTSVRLEQLPAFQQAARNSEPTLGENAVRADLEDFRHCFFHEKKSVVEDRDWGGTVFRSDMNNDILEAMDDLWNDPDGFRRIE